MSQVYYQNHSKELNNLKEEMRHWDLSDLIIVARAFQLKYLNDKGQMRDDFINMYKEIAVKFCQMRRYDQVRFCRTLKQMRLKKEEEKKNKQREKVTNA